jgi:hypothetical protein
MGKADHLTPVSVTALRAQAQKAERGKGQYIFLSQITSTPLFRQIERRSREIAWHGLRTLD